MGAGAMSATSTVAIAGLLVAIAAGVGGYGYGIDQGKALKKSSQETEYLKTVTDQITAHGDLVKQSGVASRNLRLAVAAREKVNDTTSKELGDALTTTADSRVGCVFPAGVMRHLSEARDRAAEAAASGIPGAMPGAPASTARER